jgi:hypothetical protein
MVISLIRRNPFACCLALMSSHNPLRFCHRIIVVALDLSILINFFVVCSHMFVFHGVYCIHCYFLRWISER